MEYRDDLWWILLIIALPVILLIGSLIFYTQKCKHDKKNNNMQNTIENMTYDKNEESQVSCKLQ